MNTVTLDQTIEMAMQLPLNQRKMLLDIVRRRDIESRRNEIAEDACVSIADFRAGKIKPQSVDKIIRELRKSVEDIV